MTQDEKLIWAATFVDKYMMEGELNVERAILTADNAIIKLRVIADNNKYLHRSKILQKEEGFGKGFEVRKLGG